MAPNNKAARTVARPAAQNSTSRRNSNDRCPPRLPDDWRQRLPDPARYYAQQFERLGKVNSAGWSLVFCPFHDDTRESLSVQLTEARGGFTCFACGAKGDLLAFHIRRTGLPFVEAVRDLLHGGGT